MESALLLTALSGCAAPENSTTWACFRTTPGSNWKPGARKSNLLRQTVRPQQHAELDVACGCSICLRVYDDFLRAVRVRFTCCQRGSLDFHPHFAGSFCR